MNCPMERPLRHNPTRPVFRPVMAQGVSEGRSSSVRNCDDHCQSFRSPEPRQGSLSPRSPPQCLFPVDCFQAGPVVREFEFPVRLALLRFARVWLKKPESPMLWTRPETESIPAGRSPRSSVPRVAWWLEPGRGWIWDCVLPHRPTLPECHPGLEPSPSSYFQFSHFPLPIPHPLHTHRIARHSQSATQA